MASKGPRLKTDQETRPRRQKVSSLIRLIHILLSIISRWSMFVELQSVDCFFWGNLHDIKNHVYLFHCVCAEPFYCSILSFLSTDRFFLKKNNVATCTWNI